ncbi:MAG: DUF896 domain-containing protein [Clostridiales bacterium]|jgi:uncharacterized protein YnzC (UPF0291/DUF896 family)|nr:DUF896 domain-containing protein [Clostridiales bacterium]
MDLNIDRINELYHKSQAEGLTEEEKTEQRVLREKYIEAIRKNMRGTLDRVSFVNPDGSITKAGDKNNKSC